MRIYKGNGFTISDDKNVAAYAAADYRQADMSGYNIEEPTANELKRLYDAAQRIY